MVGHKKSNSSLSVGQCSLVFILTRQKIHDNFVVICYMKFMEKIDARKLSTNAQHFEVTEITGIHPSTISA